VDSIHVAQERAKWWAVVNEGLNILVPQKGGKYLSSWGTIRFWRTMLHGVRWVIGSQRSPLGLALSYPNTNFIPVISIAAPQSFHF